MSWKLRIKGQPTNRGLRGKWALKQCVHMTEYYLNNRLIKRRNKYHLSDDVDQRAKLPTDVEEIQNADDKDGDDEAIENSSVGDESRDESSDEAGEEKNDDDGVDNVPHVTVEHSKLLSELGRLTDKELTQDKKGKVDQYGNMVYIPCPSGA